MIFWGGVLRADREEVEGYGVGFPMGWFVEVDLSISASLDTTRCLPYVPIHLFAYQGSGPRGSCNCWL